MSRKSKRDKVIATIKSLLAMTVEKGCTPDEAVAAIGRVAALMDRHRLDMADIEASSGDREDPVVDATVRSRDDVGQRLWKPAVGVSALTNTVFYNDGPAGRDHVFVGRETDVLVASYLLSVCETAMRRQGEIHDAENLLCRKAVRERRRATFLDGMSLSLMRRLLDLHEARRVKGHGLVPLDEGVQAEVRRRGLVDRWRSAGRVRKLETDSLEEGFTAGKETFIGDAVGSSRSTSPRLLS